jgi:sulfatase modifying factor 1
VKNVKIAPVAVIVGLTILIAGAIAASVIVPPPKGAAACHTPDHSEVHLPGGTFQMGSTQYYEEEGPVHPETVAPFWIDRYDVTNADLAKFVAATHYVTDAERSPDPADYPEVPKEKLVAGGAAFTPPSGGVRGTEDPMQWWSFVAGTNWRHPDGPGSTIVGHENDPVVQVSYNDALAYAKWKGRELPTEAQYEYAARGGLDGKTYGWGDDLTPGGEFMANVWQGTFPTHNTVADGFSGRAPVGCFPVNGYGLYDTTGNVWKWTSSLYAAMGKDEMLGMPMSKTPASRVMRTIKGGSFLCAPNYCRRYRPAARQSQESGFSAAHLGFRTISNRP